MRKYNLKREIEFNKGSYLAFMVISEELDGIIAQSPRDKIDLMILRDKLTDYMDRSRATLNILNTKLKGGNNEQHGRPTSS